MPIFGDAYIHLTPVQHTARVVTLVEGNTQCVLSKSQVLTHGACCFMHRFNTRYVLFHVSR